ncbi:sigma-70 family RNA polymerase sigma factor [Aestuariibacter halophilus]|uniref:Sigma-70 family RNA polymerase sigma factor n=1 Tax=Fluctibacter halophilus TaxID=226011 RepID=A0ABS8GA67_9ALTE|nr:sigma-70 family RNA polymerase sigma factor [Aestuariibacter halophilus]MCC2616986.1 sigma-70 family RNA polymerase sigma factor [Aestuariibacter halophilus]
MQTSFEHIIKEYDGLLGRVAATYEANPALQQELVQEISLALWQALPRFEGNSSLKTYILRIAHNKAVNHIAYHTRQPRTQYEDGDAMEVVAPTNTEHQISQDQQVAQLLASVRRLPFQSRQVVTLMMEGLSYQDIASVSGMTVTNVGVTLNRARKVLMENIDHVG